MFFLILLGLKYVFYSELNFNQLKTSGLKNDRRIYSKLIGLPIGY